LPAPLGASSAPGFAAGFVPPPESLPREVPPWQHARWPPGSCHCVGTRARIRFRPVASSSAVASHDGRNAPLFRLLIPVSFGGFLMLLVGPDLHLTSPQRILTWPCPRPPGFFCLPEVLLTSVRRIGATTVFRCGQFTVCRIFALACYKHRPTTYHFTIHSFTITSWGALRFPPSLLIIRFAWLRFCVCCSSPFVRGFKFPPFVIC